MRYIGDSTAGQTRQTYVQKRVFSANSNLGS